MCKSMAERPVTLNLRTPQESGARHAPTGQPRHGLPDQQAAQDFARALQQPVQTQREASSPALASSALPSPFDLLRPSLALHTPANASESAATEPASSLVSGLCGLVDKLMVGDGKDGRRMARMALDDNLLPGVVVVVQEDAGAWVAEFTCRHEESFTRLARPAQRMAFELAQALSQDAVWKVVPDGLDPQGPWAREVHFNGPDFTVEAFASPPAGGHGMRGRGDRA